MSIKVKVKLKKRSNSRPNIDLVKEKYSFYRPEVEQAVRDNFSFMSSLNPLVEEIPNASNKSKTGLANGRIERYQDTIRSAISFVTGNDRPNKEKGTDVYSQSKRAWEWAVENKKIINSQEFYNKWQFQGMIHGGENTIVFDEAKQTVLKANDLGYHKGSIIDFLERIRANNTYFPSTAYSLKGFINQNDKVIPVVEQPFIKEATDVRLSHNIIANELVRRGFLSVNKEAGLWLTPDKKYIVGDMGPSNVIMDTDSNFRFIDAIFIPTTEDNLYEYGIDSNTKV